MRNDQPMPEVYARQGFERVEIMSMSKFEKETGLVHEASNFVSGNEEMAYREPELPRAPKEVLEKLALDVAEGAASGPWTESSLPDPIKFNIPAPI